MADFNIPQLRNRRLSSLLADPSVMDNYQPTQPLSGLLDYSDPAVKAGPDAIGPPTIAGGLLSLDPTDYVGPQTLGKLAAGLKGLLAGGMVMGGIKSVGKAAPYAAAHETARKNAVKMLGLPENNTAMDRARAMGVDYPTAHGTRNDVLQIATEKTGTRIGANPSSHLGFFSTPNLPEASRYATDFGKDGGNVMPLLVRKGKTYEMPNKQFEELSMGEFTAQGATPKERWLNASEEVKALRQQLLDDGYESVVRFAGRPMEEVISLKPENVRSRFAAFDPARRHEADLLGRATPEMLGVTTLGGLLGLEAMRRNQE